jgi:transcriptional regulator of aromatic amino acid metabolism
MAAEILEKAKEEGRPVTLLMGRPYHIDPLINHKIPDILTDFGLDVITEDSVPLEEGQTLDNRHVMTQWEYLNRYFHAARWAGNQDAPRVEVVQLNSFGCGPDPFILDEVSSILGQYGKSPTVIRIDEIESMPAATQIKMLRVLEMREITPLGTNDVRPVDLRVVAAAKVDLADPAVRGDFREDLYYRLNVVTISIPPLRERREDIPLLFTYFTGRAAQRFHKSVPEFTRGLLDQLRHRDWPGNVRELSHFAERFVLGLEDNEEVSSIPTELLGASLPELLDRQEAQIIRKALELHRGDVAQTIAALGIARKTFYDKLQRHGIKRREYGLRDT